MDNYALAQAPPFGRCDRGAVYHMKIGEFLIRQECITVSVPRPSCRDIAKSGDSTIFS